MSSMTAKMVVFWSMFVVLGVLLVAGLGFAQAPAPKKAEPEKADSKVAAPPPDKKATAGGID